MSDFSMRDFDDAVMASIGFFVVGFMFAFLIVGIWRWLRN